MKISEGIRLGSKGRVQIVGAWYDSKNGICAIGALMKVICSQNVCAAFPNLQDLLPNNNFLIDEIRDRNDSGQSFKQIIEWLESIGQ